MKSIPQQGYILISTILLSLGVSMLAGTFLQYIALTSNSLNNQMYNDIAQEAARSGISYVSTCLKENPTASWTALKPDTDCTGASSTGSPYVNTHGTEWRSKFSVTGKDAYNNITSTGILELLRNGTPIQIFKATSKTSLADAYAYHSVSIGESITDIRNDESDCAIANGKLYCWGNNSNGQLGRCYTGNPPNGTYPSLMTPVNVGSIVCTNGTVSALAGKTVTQVSVAQDSVCAIADGMPYCWGSDSHDQLGHSGGSVTIPTAGVPRTSSGPLSGKFTMDIGTASQNNPASLLWTPALADPHSCALTADGAVSCWGNGDFRQLTGGGETITINWVCLPPFGFPCLPVPGYYYAFPNYEYPTYVKGYSDATGPFDGKKSTRVGASSHDSCLVAEGRMYCMGVPAPLSLWCNSVLFSGASDTLVWSVFQPCIASYSNGYDVSAMGALNGKFIDESTWQVSANEACTMANTDFVCFGQSPAFNLTWLDGWGDPWTAKSNADVTAHDHGDNIASWGISGLYCLVNKGVAECDGASIIGINAYTGTGTWGFKNFQPLIKTGSNNFDGLNGPDGLEATADDKIPTKIAAGENHGCVVANGQLLCWGQGYPHNTAVVTSNSVIGTADNSDRYAATGAISAGGAHACAVANGKLFCWGDNNFGQLGMGNNTTVPQPQAVPYLSTNFKSVTKVSAGKNHTCAIAYGKLYCWGDNTNGQLGLGPIGNTNVPTLVAGTNPGEAFYGKRVTDVSAGANGTCAIANGQAYCWGLNSNQEVGDGTAIKRTTPTPVSAAYTLPNTATNTLGGKSVTSISMGETHACAVANGNLFCWGDNSDGRTGVGLTTGNSNPRLVTGGTAGAPAGPNGMSPLVSAVSAGKDFTCAIISAKVSCWGRNADGRTGLGTLADTDTTVPTALSGAPGGFYATAISTGDEHACAVLNGNSSLTNGNLYCWGNEQDGRVGNDDATPSTDTAVAALITGGMAGKSTLNVDAGSNFTCSVSNAVVMCWGDYQNGRTGNPNSTFDVLSPVATASYREASGYSIGPIF